MHFVGIQILLVGKWGGAGRIFFKFPTEGNVSMWGSEGMLEKDKAKFS